MCAFFKNDWKVARTHLCTTAQKEAVVVLLNFTGRFLCFGHAQSACFRLRTCNHQSPELSIHTQSRCLWAGSDFSHRPYIINSLRPPTRVKGRARLLTASVLFCTSRAKSLTALWRTSRSLFDLTVWKATFDVWRLHLGNFRTTEDDFRQVEKVRHRVRLAGDGLSSGVQQRGCRVGESCGGGLGGEQNRVDKVARGRFRQSALDRVSQRRVQHRLHAKLQRWSGVSEPERSASAGRSVIQRCVLSQRI